MKISIVTPALLLMIGVGCNIDIAEDVLDGEESDEVRQLGGFTTVINRSDADVVLVEDGSGDGLSAGDVLVVCEGGIVANVDTSVDGEGNLVIQFAAEVATILGCEVRVVTEGIVEVVDEGDGDIVCEDTLRDVRNIVVRGNGSVDLASVEADELDILVEGNGALDIGHVSVDTLRIDLRGAGDATLAGDAVFATLNIAGNGDLRAQELTVSDTLDALLNGTGNGVITVLGTVNAEVHGDASLEIYGGAQPGDVLEVDGGEVIFH